MRSIILLTCAAAALLNVAPLLLFHLSGDIVFHRIIMECFATQFWQGNFYPRWCMDINSGLGAPIFIFYFPLAYFISALLWPITWLGGDSAQAYDTGCFLATWLTALSCYAWLKDIVMPRYALLASVFFLFMPYRMEVFWFRGDYAELWGMALLPLVFKYTRQMASPTPARGDAAALAASFALLLLTHVPTAAVAALGSGLYLCFMAWRNGRVWLRYGLAVLWGTAMAAFYLLPAVYYKQFIASHGPAQRPWADTYLRTLAMVEYGQYFLALVMLANILAVGLMLVWMLVKSKNLQPVLQKEIAVWAGIFALMLYLLFPVSIPFYRALPFLHQVILPWRMQNLLGPCMAFLLALWMQCLASPGQKAFWKSNMILSLAMLMIFDLLLAGVETKKLMAENAERLAAHHVIFPDEYETIWTPPDHYSTAYMDTRAAHPPARLFIVHGHGTADVKRWGNEEIHIAYHTDGPLTLRFDQTYFPGWYATEGKNKKLRLYPDTASGQMLLDIPAGAHNVKLRFSMMSTAPWMFLSSCGVSLAAFGSWCACRRKERRNG